jgi:HAD superfamily hydrolase (TIGR01509 family)
MKDGLAQALKRPGPLLLDFDGPVCSIFSEYTNAEVSAELHSVLLRLRVQLPAAVVNESDPLNILRWTDTLAMPAATHAVEDALRAAEVRAARTATPTPGARELLSACLSEGRPVAIVSNNSASAIESYISAHRLTKYFACIVGRKPYKPGHMKPNPQPVLEAVTALGAKAEACVLVGDSLSDIEAAHSAGVPVIGYANKPSKKDLFARAGTVAVVTSMTDISAHL